jgi:hypothetical protein
MDKYIGFYVRALKVTSTNESELFAHSTRGEHPSVCSRIPLHVSSPKLINGFKLNLLLGVDTKHCREN